MSYSTIADVRAFGVSSDEASDAVVTTALAVAQKRIETYTNKVFAAPASKQIVIDGVSSAHVALPPYSNITEVLVNDIALDSGSYETRPHGIFLKIGTIFDIDGFPIYGHGLSRFRRRHEVTVKVTATFGEASDEVVSFASTILAAGFARMTVDDNLPPAEVEMMRTEQIQMQQHRPLGYSTGNLEVDGMLDGLLFGGDLIG